MEKVIDCQEEQMAPIYFEEQDWFLLFPSLLPTLERDEEMECKV